jgi:ribonuclease P protein component
MLTCAQAAANAAAGKRLGWHSLGRADFAVALATPALAKSPHFVLHHVAASAAASRGPASKPPNAELSTDHAPNKALDVDNTRLPGRWWLGLVVPKRHARRSVTRSLVKRQMRVHANGNRHRLPPGQWVIRLRAAFDTGRYSSAASPQLRDAVRLELEQVFARVGTA